MFWRVGRGVGRGWGGGGGRGGGGDIFISPPSPLEPCEYLLYTLLSHLVTLAEVVDGDLYEAS